MSEVCETEGFKITDGKGFHITFKNGVTVSVQFGCCNYCSRKQKYSIYKGEMEHGIEKQRDIWKSYDCEIAIWDKNGEWLTKEWRKEEHDDVIGWQSPEDVLSALNWAKELNKREEKVRK